MKFQINKLYIWFKKDEQPRILNFDSNKVNVITGSSSTGKSNILAIIDYCLLAGNNNIVFPVINEYAEWYGLEFVMNGKLFSIARKKPTVETIASDVYILDGIGFNDDFYPTQTNAHINDARLTLDHTFGYKRDGRNMNSLYRPKLVFNYLMESIITSPYDFLNYKFFGLKEFLKQTERIALLKSVLTPIKDEYERIKENLADLQNRKNKSLNYNKSLQESEGNYYQLLKELLKKSIDVKLCDSSLTTDSEIEQFSTLEIIEKEKIEDCSKNVQQDKELRELQLQHSKKSLQLRNIERAQQEYDKYIESLSSLQDSLKPIESIEEQMADMGTNMWTKHLVDSLKQSLKEVAESNRIAKQKPLVTKEQIEALKKDIVDIENKMSEITKVYGSLYRQVDAYKIMGLIESKMPELRDLRQTMTKVHNKQNVMFTQEDEFYLDKLQKEFELLEKKQLNIINELDSCIQHIYNGLNYMEHYKDCYTKYMEGEERLMLNDGKSILNYDVIGSQSNYMFLHLCFFLGLHRYFLENAPTRIAQFLFIDQPSIPYYAGSADVQTTDKAKLIDAFKTINDFMKYVIEEKKEEFQIILIEHAPKDYWTGENAMAYFKTKETFVNGDALIPQYIIEKRRNDKA